MTQFSAYTVFHLIQNEIFDLYIFLWTWHEPTFYGVNRNWRETSRQFEICPDILDQTALNIPWKLIWMIRAELDAAWPTPCNIFRTRSIMQTSEMKNESPRRAGLIYKTFSAYPSSLLVYLWIKLRRVYYSEGLLLFY